MIRIDQKVEVTTQKKEKKKRKDNNGLKCIACRCRNCKERRVKLDTMNENLMQEEKIVSLYDMYTFTARLYILRNVLRDISTYQSSLYLDMCIMNNV